MKRYLAIRVERPRRGFATILRLRGSGTGRRGFTPLSPVQTSADVRFYQIDQGRRRQRVKPLRTVHIEDLVQSGRGRDALAIEARYDGADRAAVEITERGRLRERLVLTVEREPRKPWWLLAVFLVSILLFGFWYDVIGFRNGSEPDADTPAPTVPAAGDTVREIAGDGAGEPAVPTEEPGAARRDATGISDSATVEPTAAAETAPEAVSDTADETRTVPAESMTIYFAPNSTALTDGARREIRSLASQLPVAADTQVTIIGHAAPFGSEAGRSDISRGRAYAVFDALRDAGWAPATEPLIEWRGALEPVTMDLQEQDRNRRVELRFTRD